MEPDDRVLVAYVPSPDDFGLIQEQRWYRIPQRHAPKGLFSEWLAFYFGRAFGPLRYAVHYIAPTRGHELVRRCDLLPNQPDHPRADDIYYKIQLGPLQQLARPIVSLRRRRILFIHTTGDRFCAATELGDLLIDGPHLTDRRQIALREAAARPYRRRRSGPLQPPAEASDG